MKEERRRRLWVGNIPNNETTDERREDIPFDPEVDLTPIQYLAQTLPLFPKISVSPGII